jgi:hypothetical protein
MVLVGGEGECIVFSQWLVSRKHDLNQGSAQILSELGLVIYARKASSCVVFFNPGPPPRNRVRVLTTYVCLTLTA